MHTGDYLVTEKVSLLQVVIIHHLDRHSSKFKWVCWSHKTFYGLHIGGHTVNFTHLFDSSTVKSPASNDVCDGDE